MPGPALSPEIKSLSKQGFCEQCQVTKHNDDLKRCAGCQSAKYCSPECQKANWKQHKPQCKSRAARRLETEDESWEHITATFGHKRSNQRVLGPVTESLEQQNQRFRAWVLKWEDTILDWAFWAMNIPSPSTREDKLLYFTFAFEIQRRANPPSPDLYFEMHGAEIMHTSHLIALMRYMDRVSVLDQWRKLPRRKDTIQVMIGWKGHTVFLNRPVKNFVELQTAARNDPVRSRFYDALSKDWRDELGKAIDSGDPKYHTKFYDRYLKEILEPEIHNPLGLRALQAYRSGALSSAEVDLLNKLAGIRQQ